MLTRQFAPLALYNQVCASVCLLVFLPAFFRVLVSFIVELEGDFGVQADAEVVVHHTLL